MPLPIQHTYALGMADTRPFQLPQAPADHRAGRYAPSPSGALHLGNLRTALLAWAFARTEGRPFVMRVEDIDDYKTRELGYQQLDDLRALGLDWDGDVVWSSHRHAAYQQAIDYLTAQGLTFPVLLQPQRHPPSPSRTPHPTGHLPWHVRQPHPR